MQLCIVLTASGGAGGHDSKAVCLEQHAQNILYRLIILHNQDEVHGLRHSDALN
jgi:hypothetical protein